MPTYYDPTESRKSSRLQKEVIDIGKPLKHLEMLTGADLLVTPTEKSITIPDAFAKDIDENALRIIGSINKRSPMEIAQYTEIPLPAILSAIRFWKACRVGILIQRKSGHDFTNSIPKLSEILGRMIIWTPDPWLLIAANIGCDRNAKAVVDGTSTSFTYQQVISAKMSWMMSGGNVIEISRDSLTAHVIGYAEKKLKELAISDEKFVVRQKWVRQNVVGPNDEDWERLNLLINLPGIGHKRAKNLFEYAGSLTNAFLFLSDTEDVKKLGRNEVARPSDSKKFKQLFEMDNNDVFTLVAKYGKNE